MATQGSHNGSVQNNIFFFTFVTVLFICIFVQKHFNILKLMYIKELLYFDMSAKFDEFLKNNLENIGSFFCLFLFVCFLFFFDSV